VANSKLSGIIAQHHGIAQEVVGVDTAPGCSLGCNQHRIWGCGQSGEAEQVEVRRPDGLLGEDRAIRGAARARLRM
jgi:hypothetical protein